jgi:hypothetical protein
MPTINQLPLLNVISSGDQLPVYSPNNGDARRTSIGSLLTFFQQSFASPTLSVNLYVPGSGFNITVPTPVSNDQWMLLQPAGTLATGTITLPLNTGVPDGTSVLITSTQEITSLTIALNGATALYGGATNLSAGSATALRFYQPTNSWYQINRAPLGVATATSLSTTGNQVITGTGKQGYDTGSGGIVTQLTSKATGVTLSKSTGQITLNNAALAASTTVSFALTNTVIEAGDILIMNHISGGTAGSYLLNAQSSAGAASINVRNISLGSLSEAIVIAFAVIKAVSV